MERVTTGRVVHDIAQGARRLSPAEVEAHLLAQDALLIDLREPEELQEHGLIAGSMHVPRGLLESRADPASPMHRPEFDPQRLTIVYCGVGDRSALAVGTLTSLGYLDVAELDGGIVAWKQAGAPVAGLAPWHHLEENRTTEREGDLAMTLAEKTITRSDYTLEGTLLEVCSCGVLCPCFIGEDPDGGECVAVVAYQLDRGEIGGVDVAGLTIANVVQIPGNALAGGWRAVVIIDEAATEAQHDALLAAFGGDLGGGLADLAGLVDEVVAVEQAPISHAVESGAGTLRIDGVLEAEITPITGASGEQTTLQETMFSTVPGAPAYVAKAERFSVDLAAYGMSWTFENHNAVQTPWRMEHAG